MSTAFGFSAGNFIAAIQLVATVIDALRETGGAGEKFHELICNLRTLHTNFEMLKAMEYNESQYFGFIELYHTVKRIQVAIAQFWKKASKYQPYLRNGGSNSRLKNGWMKVR